jgi:hypothetical protein
MAQDLLVFIELWVMVFKATFNNISFISLLSVLLVQDIGVNHRLSAGHQQTLSNKAVSSTPRNTRDSNSQL